MAKKHKPIARHERTISTRSYTRAPSTVDVEAGRFGVIAATETPVRTYVSDPRMPDRGIEADEVLELSGLDLSRAAGMPLVDGHDVYGGIKSILGKIDNVRIEGEAVVADAELNSRNGDLIGDIARGHYAQVSIGYDYDAGRDAVLEERDGNVPIVRVKRWTLTEISLVPVGADPNASVRAKRRAAARNSEQETVMDELEQAIVAAEEALAAVDEALTAVDEAIQAAGDNADVALIERARKLRGKRDDGGMTDEEKKAAEEAARSKRQDDVLTDEEKKAEADAVRSIRSIAVTYGLGTKVDDLVKLGTRASAIQTFVRSSILGKAASAPAAPVSVKPSTPQRSAPVIDTDAIYARHNKR